MSARDAKFTTDTQNVGVAKPSFSDKTHRRNSMRKTHLAAILLVFVMMTAALLVACSPEVPAPTAGQDTVVYGMKKTPDKVDAKTAVFATLGTLDQAQSYVTEGNGKTVAQKGYITYTQNSEGYFVKHGDEYYNRSVSTSTFVNVKHEAFLKGANIATRKDGGEIVNNTTESYKSVYGVTPDKLLSGHVFNQDTIIHAELVDQTDGKYTFEIILDKASGNSLLCYQMKEFGGLNGYPTFTENTKVTLVIDQNYTPISLAYASKYSISIPVLGELDCSESFLTTFGEFGKDNAIPDTDKFNAAMSSTPTVIKPDDESQGISEEAQTVVDALLATDVTNGVSLSGILNAGEYQLPLKINAKADVDAILNGDNLFERIEAKFALNIGKEISVTYYEGKFYVNVAGSKYVFSSDLTNTETDFGSFDDNMFIVSKNESRQNTYTVKLATKYNDNVYSALKSWGIVSCSKREFDLHADLYIPDGNLGTIEVFINAGDKHISLCCAVANEYYQSPTNLADYQTKLRFGVNAGITASLGDIADAEIVAELNTTELNLTKALHAEAKITLGDVKSLLGMASMSGSELPAWISAIADGDFAKVILDNQKLYLLVYKASEDGTKTNVVYAEQLADLGVSQNAVSTYDANPMISLILSQLPTYIQSGMDGGEFVVSLTDALLSIVNEAIANHVIEDALFDAMGNYGGMVAAMLGLDKPIENVYLTLSPENKSLSLEIKSCNVSSGDVYVPSKEYDVVSTAKITLTLPESVDDFVFQDVTQIMENRQVAKVIEAQISDLIDSYNLTSAFTAKLNALAESFDKLTEEQKLLMGNAMVEVGNVFVSQKDSIFNVLKERVNTETNAVSDFAASMDAGTDIAKLNKTFDAFTQQQITLFQRQYTSKYDTYIAARKMNEETARTELEAEIGKLDQSTDLSKMTVEQLKAYLKQLDKLYKQYQKLLKYSLSNKAEITLIPECDRAAQVFCDKVVAEAEKLLAQLTDQTYYDTLTVKQALELHGKAKTFNDDYAVKNYSFAGILTVVPQNYETTIYKVTYYAQYCGKAFRKFAATVAEKEIEAITGGTYAEDKINAAIDDLNALLAVIDKDAVESYDKYQKFVDKRNESALQEFEQELITLTQTLKAHNEVADQSTHTDWDEIDALATAAEAKLKKFSDSLLNTIKATVDAFKEQKSIFDDYYFDYAW